MSVTREAMAAALSTVAGLTGSAFRPPTLYAGAGWPVWRSTRTDVAGCAREVRWYVMVVLANADQATAPEHGGPLVEPVIAAMMAAGLSVESVEAVSLPIAPGGETVPAMRTSVIDHVWSGP